MADRRSRFQRLWLLFAVVATALVWTWSQVGQRQSVEPLSPADAEDFRLLHIEKGCNLAVAPCAAYGDQLALVATVTVEGEGLRWRVKLIGEGLPAQPKLTMELHRPGAGPASLNVVRVADEWQAFSPGLVRSGSALRVRLAGGALPWLVDYPLSGKP